VKRGAAALAGLLLLGGGLLVAARGVALSKAEAALTSQGLTWTGTTRGPLSAQWFDLAAPGLSASSLSLTLLPRPTAVLTGVDIDLDAIQQRPSGSSGGGGGMAVPVSLSAEGVTVQWKGTVLAEDLSGTLLPTLALSGPGARLSRTGDGWSGELSRYLPEDAPLSGLATLTVSGSGPVTLDLSVPEAVISHPVLAPRPLPPIAITATAQWQNGHIDGTAQVGGIVAALSGGLSSDAADLDLTATEVPFEAILDLFGDSLIPEHKRTEVVGTLTLTAHLTGLPVAWSAIVSADGLGAEGVLHDPTSMRRGNFSWRAPGPDGGFVLRRTGDDHPTWTDLPQARLAGDAAIASEDARFASHGGYDIEGINVALKELAEGVERPRGGSTITQQLAKNLFLDGERTIARKLRELLYALELERALGKRRILELYLNIVEYGPGVYGIRQASDHYFLKRPENLSPHEAAFLAAILPSPRTWHDRVMSGRAAPERTIDRILNNMVNTGALDAKAARWAIAERLIIIPPAAP
jgi:hypothetical protein